MESNTTWMVIAGIVVVALLVIGFFFWTPKEPDKGTPVVPTGHATTTEEKEVINLKG